ARRAVGLVHFDVQAAAFEIPAQHVAGPHLLAGGDGAVVHALVADELLEQLDGLRGQVVVHAAGATTTTLVCCASGTRRPGGSTRPGASARANLSGSRGSGPAARSRRWSRPDAACRCPAAAGAACGSGARTRGPPRRRSRRR